MCIYIYIYTYIYIYICIYTHTYYVVDSAAVDKFQGLHPDSPSPRDGNTGYANAGALARAHARHPQRPLTKLLKAGRMLQKAPCDKS